METNLVEYGIQTEDATWRIHVCFKVKRLYVFRVEDGVAALKYGEEKDASQEDIQTATGRTVPWDLIPNIEEVVIPQDILDRHWVEQDDDHSAKGEAAQEIVLDVLYRAHGMLIPCKIVTDLREQIKGRDLQYFNASVQVKCDWRGGRKELGGSGNLYLQTHERNPFKKH